jgi:Asp-tRNA(Asn)/Glu-tRNA(Gln) amidotransferase A subunit family amidase
MTKELHTLSATDAIAEIEAERLSAVQLVTACMERSAELDESILAWEYLDPETALRQARAFDEGRAKREPVGRLNGVPVGVKDIFNTQDMPTCMGSPIFLDFRPGNDARSVFSLRQHGATVLGKTVTAEFAVHALDKTRNPHDISRSPGTSSSGSAAAVAAGMVPLALGTQTAGSIVRPASYCGVFGCKPSFGLIPRTGILKTTDTLDQIGYFARSVADIELMLEVLRVRGRDYPISDSALSDQGRQSPLGQKWRVGVVTSDLWVWNEAYPYAQNSIRKFAGELSAFADVDELRLPEQFNRAHDLHAVIYNKTLAYYFREEFSHNQLISDVLNSMIREGQGISLPDYQRALEAQAALAKQLDGIFEHYDVLIALSTAGSAPTWGEPDIPDSALIWSLCGVPVVSAPIFESPDAMPFGAQFISRRNSDYKLFRFLRYMKELGLVSDAEVAGDNYLRSESPNR